MKVICEGRSDRRVSSDTKCKVRYAKMLYRDGNQPKALDDEEKVYSKTTATTKLGEQLQLEAIRELNIKS